MLVSGSNNQYFFLQQRATTTTSDSPQKNDLDTFAALLDGPPTQHDLQTGFFGRSRSTLDSVAATGKYVVNTLSYLTASDIDLIQRTTGVTIKDGGYYDSDGNQLGIHSDSHGNLLDPNPGQSKAAFDLAFVLSDMRSGGGPEGDTSLQKGRKVTVVDLENYLKDYAAAKASDQNVYVPDTDVIKQAEQILSADFTLGNTATKQQPITDFSFLTPSDIDLIQRTTGVRIKDGYIRDSEGNRLGFSESRGSPLDPNPTQTKAAFDLGEALSDMRMHGGIQGDTSLLSGRKLTADDLEAYLKGYAAVKASGQNNAYVPNEAVIKRAEQILTSGQAPTDSNKA